MIEFFVLLGVVMALAIIYNVVKYRRDLILGVIVAIAIKIAARAHDKIER